MLSQGSVPNTYAAGRASLAAWSRREQPQPQPAKRLDASHPLCECGNRKPRGRHTACEACTALDSRRAVDLDANAEAVDRAVLEAFTPGAQFTIGTLAEHFSYKRPRHMLSRALRRLFNVGELRRERVHAYSDGYTYSLSSEQ